MDFDNQDNLTNIISKKIPENIRDHIRTMNKLLRRYGVPSPEYHGSPFLDEVVGPHHLIREEIETFYYAARDLNSFKHEHLEEEYLLKGIQQMLFERVQD